MTVRRLAVLTVIATLCLVAAVLANILVGGTDQALAVSSDLSPVPSDSSEPAAAPEPMPELTPEPLPDPTPDAAPELVEVIDVAPPAWVEIPEDLISTPTPDAPTSVPLPFLTNIPSAPRDGSVVYLTFDDGPNPVHTTQILDLLAQYNAKATFFVLGNSADAYPGIVQRMVAEGHTVGNHTYYHEALPVETEERVIQTLGATNGAIARAVGHTTTCLRPPYGALDQKTYDLVSGQGYGVHMWEVDSEDWKTNDSYTIAANVLANTSLGDRILFHDGPSNRAATVAALASVLEVLSNRGVGFHALNC